MIRKFYAHSLEDKTPEFLSPVSFHISSPRWGEGRVRGGMLGACNGKVGKDVQFFEDVPVFIDTPRSFAVLLACSTFSQGSDLYTGGFPVEIHLKFCLHRS